VADARGLDFDQNLALFVSVELNRLESERLPGLESHGSACFHEGLLGAMGSPEARLLIASGRSFTRAQE
jgi:hypothetical protein